MCLTGVDYFSSIGFQPSVAYVAAGILSPFATLVLVVMNLFGALPAYWVVAKESPHGQGSFAMLERTVRGWAGKLLVLAMLAFGATGFLFTITVCTADAARHFVENPWTPDFLKNQLGVTLLLILMLGAVFLRGFREAIGVSVVLVAAYLSLNAITIVRCCFEVFGNPALVGDWLRSVSTVYPQPQSIWIASAIAFPQLVLGMSGFETGVAVMPLVKGDSQDTAQQPSGRIRSSRKLLFTAAAIMAVLLIVSSVVTTLLIRPELYREGAEANGRALAYLAHTYLGDLFGTLYDTATILILWFAGASTMAALLSLVPQYLPRYGMAPQWAAAQRPLVVFFTAVCCLITLIFQASIDAQVGAFATGLLILLTSAAVAALIATWRKPAPRLYFLGVSLCFVYASVAIMTARPDGLLTAIILLVLIFIASFMSRSLRSTELRVKAVEFDDTARCFVLEATKKHWGVIRLLAHKPDDASYKRKEQDARHFHSIQEPEGDFIFLEVVREDSSEFYDESLSVTGEMVDGYPILRCKSPAVPNAIAALLLQIAKDTGQVPHAYFGWTEGHPIGYILKYIFFGEGETAPLTREILRSAQPDVAVRPVIHVA